MHKLNYIPCRTLRLQFSRLLLAFVIAAAISQAANSQSTQTDPTSAPPTPDTIESRWKALGPSKTLSPQQWNVLPHADVYAEYGLKKLTSRVYSDGKVKTTVEFHEMRHPSGAFGLYTFNRAGLSPNRKEFFKGKYLASVYTDGDQPPNQELIGALRNLIVDDSEQFSTLPSHLPAENRISESEQYLAGPLALSRHKSFGYLKDVVNFTGGVEIVSADYMNGDGVMNLAIVEYHTPQSATEGLARASAYLSSLNDADKAQRLLKRVGNYVVEIVNIKDAQAAQRIAGQIKYTQKVYWAGRKLSDVPLDFRPMDSAALEEARQTTFIVVRSLYAMVVMVAGSISIGIVLGGVFFYWKRYRRRKLGTDEFFSDTGDTVRLNLDDYLLQPEDGSLKQIGSGNNKN